MSRIVPYHLDGEVMCGSQPIPTQNAAYGHAVQQRLGINYQFTIQ